MRGAGPRPWAGCLVPSSAVDPQALRVGRGAGGWLAGAGFTQDEPHSTPPQVGALGLPWSAEAGRGGAGRGEESLSRLLVARTGQVGLSHLLLAGTCGWMGSEVTVSQHLLASQTRPLSAWRSRPPPSDLWVGAGVLGCVCWGPGEVTGPAALTGAQLLLQERDLLTQRVDAVQLLEGVGQEAARVRESVLQGAGGQAVQWGQHQLQLLWGGQGPGEPAGRPV